MLGTPVGRMLALGLEDGRVMLVDEETGEVRWAVQAHSGGDRRTRVATSMGCRFVASVGRCEDQWKLWDAASGAVHRVGPRHDGKGACICMVPDIGQRVLQEGCPVVAHTNGLCAVAFSGQRFATGGFDGVIVWDAQTGKAEQRMIAGEVSAVAALSFSCDGALLAGGDYAGPINIWDATMGALLRTIPAAEAYLQGSVHFSPCECRLLASGGGHEISLWDVDSGEKVGHIEGRRLAVFSPNGRTIATSCPITLREVRVVDVKSGAFQSTMVANESYLSSASFSIDNGSRLASGSYDGTCRVWDSSTGALLRTIHVGNDVDSVAWSRDWERDEKCVAFALGLHPRLGAGSEVLELEVGVVRMILDRV